MIKSLKKPSIEDVARMAGVSKATVSRVLNQNDVVDPNMIELVHQAIKELDYVPRPNRRRSGHLSPPQKELGFGSISFVFPGPQREGIRTPLSLQLINGAEKYFFENQINLITSFWQTETADQKEIIPVCIQNRQVDGIICRSGDLNKTIKDKVRGLPVVQVFQSYPIPGSDHVYADNLEIGKLAFKSLVKKGHRRLACLNGFTNHESRRTRSNSFLEEADRAACEVVFYESELNDQSCCEKFLADPNRPDAVFNLAEDHITDYLLHLMRDKNLKPGKDIDIAAVIHEPVRFTHLDGEITMISIQAEQIGFIAAEILLDRIKNPGMALRKTLVEPKIINAGH